MAPEDNIHKCDACGHSLVQSRKFIASTNVYWNKPWGGALKMSVPVIPYACMECGRVFLFLGDHKRILREFKDFPEEEQRKYIQD
jgi:DNA-directed RNA polymerase subunit RPC12/RpoP